MKFSATESEADNIEKYFNELWTKIPDFQVCLFFLSIDSSEFFFCIGNFTDLSCSKLKISIFFQFKNNHFLEISQFTPKKFFLTSFF